MSFPTTRSHAGAKNWCEAQMKCLYEGITVFCFFFSPMPRPFLPPSLRLTPLCMEQASCRKAAGKAADTSADDAAAAAARLLGVLQGQPAGGGRPSARRVAGRTPRDAAARRIGATSKCRPGLPVAPPSRAAVVCPCLRRPSRRLEGTASCVKCFSRSSWRPLTRPARRQWSSPST